MPRSRRKHVDMTVEEFDAWVAAGKRLDKTAEAAENRPVTANSGNIGLRATSAAQRRRPAAG